jgi:predicted nucleic acid-binding Zn ribbon protein
MPIYDYKCAHCDAQATIVRSVSEMETPPEPSEFKEIVCTSKDGHQWKRELGTFSLVRGKNWSGSKGNW